MRTNIMRIEKLYYRFKKFESVLPELPNVLYLECSVDD
jgi:hypothetical protein